MSIPLPLVSCICVTKGRPAKLKRAIRLFSYQTYAEKELVVVCDINDLESLKVVADACIDVNLVLCDSSLSLGALRNMGISKATGEYFCQWDDDDWYHRNRLSEQLAALQENAQDACVLTNWIIFDEVSCSAYFSAFRFWEGSIICRRSLVTNGDIEYPDHALAEDTIFVGNLVKKVGLFPLVKPYLYIYNIHGENSWSSHQTHFDKMKSRSQFLGQSISMKIGEIVGGGVSFVEGCDYLQSREFIRYLKYSFFDNLTILPHEVELYLSNA